MKETPAMDARTVEVMINLSREQMRARLEKAASIAKAAEACADSGSVEMEKGIAFARDVEEPIDEAGPPQCGQLDPSHRQDLIEDLIAKE
jgi:hypothetical protein